MFTEVNGVTYLVVLPPVRPSYEAVPEPHWYRCTGCGHTDFVDWWLAEGDGIWLGEMHCSVCCEIAAFGVAAADAVLVPLA